MTETQQYVGPIALYRGFRQHTDAGRLLSALMSIMLFAATGGLVVNWEFEPIDHHMMAEGYDGAWCEFAPCP